MEKDAFLFLVFENGLSLAYLKAFESQDSAVLLNSSMSFGYEIRILSVWIFKRPFQLDFMAFRMIFSWKYEHNVRQMWLYLVITDSNPGKPFSNRLKMEIGKNNNFLHHFQNRSWWCSDGVLPSTFLASPPWLLSKHFYPFGSLCATKEEKLFVWADSTRQQTSKNQTKNH